MATRRLGSAASPAQRALRRRGSRGLVSIVLVTVVAVAAGCGGSEEGAETTVGPATTAPATTVPSTTTAPTTAPTVPAETVSYREAVFGMLNLLLTTDEAGGGWIDQGRTVRPPADLSFLCPEGLAIVETPAAVPAVEVGTMLRPNGPDGSPDLGVWIDQTIMLSDGDGDLFATWVAALDACDGIDPWQTPDWGIGSIQRLDTRDLGVESAAFRMTLDEGTGEAGWIEARLVLLQVGPVVMGVEAGAVLPPDQATSSVGDDEWLRIAEVATAELTDAMADAEDPELRVGEPDEDSELAIALLDRLLTTEDLGSGWVDQGRIVVPAGMTLRTGADLLCTDGQASADPLGTRLDPMVMTRYRRGAPPDQAFVTETLVSGAASQIAQDYATWVAALDACAGLDPWQVPEAGSVTIDRLEDPQLATQSVLYAITAGDPTSGSPSIDTHVLIVLVQQGETGTVLEVSTTNTHDQTGQAAVPVDDAELERIAEAAVTKLLES